MAKIMLVEDDTNLAEIYQARLQAEGYQIVSAHDGEAALALAAKEKPELIISDVMMPKISGFEMLDILRNTEGLKTAKVIMLTALGQAEDKTRAEGLGADRYLVKSQVTLEDIVKAVQELLNGDSAPAAAPSPASTPAQQPTNVPVPVAVAPTPPTPTQPAAPVAMPVAVAPALATAPATAAPTPQVPATPVLTSPATPVQAPTPANIPMRTEPVAPAPAAASAVAAPPTTAPPQIPAPTSQTVTAQPQIPAPAPVAHPAAAADDKLVSDAVNNLIIEAAPHDTPTASNPAPTPSSQPTNPPASAPATPVAAPPPPTQTSTPPGQLAEPTPQSSAQEAAAIQEQIASFEQQPGKANTPASTPPPSPTSPTPAPDNATPSSTDATSDNVAIAHKKIIRPLPSTGTPKSNLESLLADEERKNPGNPNPITSAEPQNHAAATPPAPHQPGHVIAPDAEASGPNTGHALDPNDPNNIAL